jgi:hypothetical protein
MNVFLLYSHFYFLGPQMPCHQYTTCHPYTKRIWMTWHRRVWIWASAGGPYPRADLVGPAESFTMFAKGGSMEAEGTSELLFSHSIFHT